MTKELFQRFSEHEDDLIRRFHQHPFFVRFGDLPDAKLKAFLIQKWFVSEAFVPTYDRAVNALNDDKAKLVLKRIIADESPVGLPTHREDLIADLEFVGVPKDEVLTTNPSPSTLRYIRELNGLVDYTTKENHDLRVMAGLRTASEILAAEEYRHVVPELERRFGLTPDRSRFYAPHFYHDRKDSETGSHTHSFETVLERMMSDEEKLDTAIQSAENAFRIRSDLYSQFISSPRRRYYIGAIAGSALGLGLILGNLGEKQTYGQFLDSLDPDSSIFYARLQKDADRINFEKYLRTGGKKQLEKIGTYEGMSEIFGDWP